jgi:hypothetical protein
MENDAASRRRLVARRQAVRRGWSAHLLAIAFTVGCGSSLPGGTGGSGGAIGSGGSGGATGGNVGSGGFATGGNVGSGGGGGSMGCPKTQPGSVCCLALVDHDPLTEPFVCVGNGTWVCPTGTIPEPSISGCIIHGTGGSVGSGGNGGIGGHAGTGGIGGIGGSSGATGNCGPANNGAGGSECGKSGITCCTGGACDQGLRCIKGDVCARLCSVDGGASSCPTGSTCQTSSACCVGTGCAALAVMVCL